MAEQNLKNGTDLPDAQEPTLEEAFSQIEEILAAMEKPDISLSASFEAYERGIALLKLCNEKIDRVEKQMIILHTGAPETEEE